MIIIEATMRPDALRRVEPMAALLFQGEVNAHQIRVRPVAGVDFSGKSIVAKFLRADGERVEPQGTVDATTGKAVLTLTSGCYAAFGVFKLFIFAADANETVCIYSCTGEVIRTQGTGTAADPATPIVQPSPEAVFEGGLTLGKGTADEATLSAAQLKALKALLS